MSFDLKTQIQPPVIIIGLARSGLSAQKLLLASGFSDNDILTFDEKKPEAMYKSEAELENLTHIKTAIVSPGVTLQKKFILAWRKRGVIITSEINLAMSHITDEKIVGITGSLGKSTTTSIIGSGLHTFDPNAFVGGNLGTPFCDYALLIRNDPSKKAKWIALELSSYQLENAEQLSLDFGAITYLSPNHLERYKSLDEYYETKWSMLNRTKQTVVLNAHGGDLKAFSASRPEKKIIWAEPGQATLKKYQLERAQLIGRHNLDNLALSAILGQEAQFPESFFEGIKKFRGLRHRLENLGEKNNVIYINDSKATTIDSVKAAVEATLESFPNLPIYLLLGGRDKKLPWDELLSNIQNPNLKLMFFGEHGKTIKSTLSSSGESFDTLRSLLAYLGQKGMDSRSVVLLSPGGVSQDEFSSFEERGDFFKLWFNRLT